MGGCDRRGNMRVTKRKSALIFLIFCLLVVFFAPHSYSSDAIPDPSTLDIAGFETTKRFGNHSTAHFLRTFYDPQGAPAVHLFLVTKDQESIPEDIEESMEGGRKLLEQGESLIQAGQSEEGERLIANSRTLLLQEDRYGTLLVSAGHERPCLVAFHHGLPTYLIAKAEAKERAEAFSNRKHVTPLGVVYLSPLEYYLEFEVERQSVLVSPFYSKIISRADLEKIPASADLSVSEEQGEDPSDRIQRNPYDLQEEDRTGADLPGQSPDSQIIPGVPDYNQRPSLPNSCAPTAGACLLGYWDAQGYEDFLQGEGNYGDVTCLIEELCGAMAWDSSFGVYYSQVPVGLQYIIDDRGYELDISNLYGIGSLEIVRQEIIEGRPFIYGSQDNPWACGHYVVVVGYQGSFIIVHDNWWSTPTDYFVNWDALGHHNDMMSTLVPQGQQGPPSEPLPSEIGGSRQGCFISALIPEK